MSKGRSVPAVLLATLAATAVWVGPARAGGGCQGGPSYGRGETVFMSKLCFTPSTLRTDPGATVTFVNKDPLIHNVSAMGWADASDLRPGDSFTATFRDEGTYPFACTYHVGMTGVVVVGDGEGPGDGVRLGRASPIAAVEEAGDAPQPGSAPTGPGWTAVTVAALAGAAAGAALTLWGRRRSRLPQR